MGVDEAFLTKKLETLSNTQEAIQSLSMVIQQYKKLYKLVTQVWLKTIRTTSKGPSHRLTLFYLANDVIQNAKKKGITEYVDEFERILPGVMPLLKDEKIINNVQRVVTIWRERGIYKYVFLDRLQESLGSQLPPSHAISSSPTELSATEQIIASYKLSNVVSAMEVMKGLEKESSQCLGRLSTKKLSILNIDITNHLKDKTLGDHLVKEAEDAVTTIENVVSVLEKEVSHRNTLIEELTKGLIYYVVQNSEVDQAFKAYVKIGQNVARVLKAMTNVEDRFQPPSNAPSPTESEDSLVLPSNSPVVSQYSTQPTITSPSQTSNTSNSHTLSLDKRLESILKAAGVMPGASNGTSASPATTPAATYYTPPSQQQRFSQPNLQQLTSVQPIQSVISTRSDPVTEPADMDIANSDEEDNTGYGPAMGRIPLPSQPPPLLQSYHQPPTSVTQQQQLRQHVEAGYSAPLPPSHREAVNRAYLGQPPPHPSSSSRGSYHSSNRPKRDGWAPRDDCRPLGRGRNRDRLGGGGGGGGGRRSSGGGYRH